MIKKFLLSTLSLGAINLFYAQSSTISSGGTLTGSGKVEYTIGSTFFTQISGTGGIVSLGNQQVYDISSTLGTDINYINLEIAVYPNPTTDFINLKIEGLEKDYEFYLYNATGNLLKKQRIKETTTPINARALPIGMYILSVKKDNQIIKTFKILKK